MELVIVLVLGLALGGGTVAVYYRQIKAVSPEDAVLKEKLRQLEEDKQALQAEKQALNEKLDIEKGKRINTEAKLEHNNKTMAEWEQRSEKLMEKNSLLMSNSLQELSDKLFDRNKKQADATLKTGEKGISDVSENLQKHFDKLMKDITGFEERLGQQESAVSILKRILSEPAKIGATGEIILENSLKAADLVEGQDFLLQESFNLEGSKFRPDAVVLLPDENVIIIDSKISSVLAELALAEGDENIDEEALNKKLKEAMRTHLKSLDSKEYKNAVNKGIESKYRSFKPKQVITLMWVSTDGILEKIYRADPELFKVASGRGILISGPSALQATITIAAIKIKESIQSENQSLIAKEANNLLKTVNTALGHAHTMGKNIQNAHKFYDKFASSVNTRLFPKAQQIIKLGAIAPSGAFKTPLPRNQTIETIEAEEHEEGEKRLIEIEIPEVPSDESQDD